MNELKIFNNAEFGQVRTVELVGKIYFVGNDIAKALEYARPYEAVTAHCKGAVSYRIPTNGGEQEAKVIPEGDIYRLIVKAADQSKNPDIKEKAERFESWVFDEVLPTIRKTGAYETPKAKAHAERLASVNNAVKILTPMLEKAGCNSQIQLLTAKSLYEKAGVMIPIEIQADKRYWDTVYIARQAGIYYESSGKPADKAVNEIIRRIGVAEGDYTETWESKGKWQGTVRKYSDAVIDRVACWLADNDYPETIQYEQCDGQKKHYHVTYKNRGAA